MLDAGRAGQQSMHQAAKQQFQGQRQGDDQKQYFLIEMHISFRHGLMGAFLFMVPAIILSGFTTPIANMPVVVQKITLLDPLRYFMVVIRGVFLENTPFYLLVDQYWPMAIIGFVSLSVAAWLFRHRIN